MDSALTLHRLLFAFTISYHYLFPQLTMGLALLIVVLKTMGLRTGDPHYDRCARFWTKIFGVNFAMGVVTGLPMEFQFGTNWARFSEAAGAVVGHLLAMEGVYSFFLESTFLGLVLFGEKRLSRVGHYLATVALFVGTWLSGFFIVATNSWMQHPVGAVLDPITKTYRLTSLWAVLTNPWAVWQYPHTMVGAVVTGSFAMASIGAFYLLSKRHEAYGRTFVTVGVLVGLPASLAMAFPTGDGQAKLVATHQPVTMAAMEGLFHTQTTAPIALIGQPDMEKLRLDNPIEVPGVLSFLTYKRWGAEVKGLTDFPRDLWPQNIPLLYYSYHIMVGLGTIFIATMSAAALLLWRQRLYSHKPVLWALMLMLPFPYIANTAGWMTAELGRQPWLIYGWMKTEAGSSLNVSAGNGLFVLLGFCGMYTVLGILALFLLYREIEHGPGDGHVPEAA